MKKTIILSSLLLGFIFLTGCSQQPNKSAQIYETINWQIYQNNNLGFEIKYPKELQAKSEDANSRGFGLYADTFENPLASGQSINNDVSGKKMVLFVGGFDDSMLSSYAQLGFKNKGKTTIGEYQAEKLFKPQSKSSQETTIYFINSKGIGITFFGSGFNQNNQDQILSTLKFTK